MQKSTISWAAVYVAFGGLLAFRVLGSSALLDRLYGQGLYPVAQTVLRVCFGWWPVPATAVGLVVLSGLLIVAIGRRLRRPGRKRRKMASAGLLIGHTVLLLATWFMLCWGVNYGRPTVPERMGLTTTGTQKQEGGEELPETVESTRQLLPTSTLVAELSSVTETINALRADLDSGQTNGHAAFIASAAYPLGANLQATLHDIGADTLPIRGLRILPAGTLLRFGTAGVFSPWTGDPHVDGGLHSLQMPFTATHELAHAQGITDEGDCNLLAYLACRRSKDPTTIYSAELTYYRYLRSAVARRDRAEYDRLAAELSPGVAADLAEIRQAMDRFTEIAPKARDLIYDSYLKTQGVSEGLASYGRIIDWVVAAKRERPELFPALRSGPPARFE